MKKPNLDGVFKTRGIIWKKGGGGDLEKSFVPSAIEKAPEIPSSSPIVSIEELTPPFRSLNGRDKGKLVFYFWDDPSLAVTKAHDVISMNELKDRKSVV